MQDIENQNNTIALAQNFLSIEQPDSALTYLCRYTSIDSTDLNINRLKAYAYNQAGLHQDAIKLYQKIRQSGDRPVRNIISDYRMHTQTASAKHTIVWSVPIIYQRGKMLTFYLNWV